jgi:hypothetical protein
MEKVYSVCEMGVWEFWGTYAECIEYVNRNSFVDSFFTIERV